MNWFYKAIFTYEPYKRQLYLRHRLQFPFAYCLKCIGSRMMEIEITLAIGDSPANAVPSSFNLPISARFHHQKNHIPVWQKQRFPLQDLTPLLRCNLQCKPRGVKPPPSVFKVQRWVAPSFALQKPGKRLNHFFIHKQHSSYGTAWFYADRFQSSDHFYWLNYLGSIILCPFCKISYQDGRLR